MATENVPATSVFLYNPYQLCSDGACEPRNLQYLAPLGYSTSPPSPVQALAATMSQKVQTTTYAEFSLMVQFAPLLEGGLRSVTPATGFKLLPLLVRPGPRSPH